MMGEIAVFFVRCAPGGMLVSRNGRNGRDEVYSATDLEAAYKMIETKGYQVITVSQEVCSGFDGTTGRYQVIARHQVVGWWTKCIQFLSGHARAVRQLSISRDPRPAEELKYF